MQIQRNAVHIFKNYFFKIHFNIILPLMADLQEAFRIAFQISKGMWNPQYNTKQETRKQ